MVDRDYSKLLRYVKDIYILGKIEQALSWDQYTYMPPGAAKYRGQQIAEITSQMHRKYTSKRLGKLLDLLKGREGLTEGQQAVVREVSREHHRRTSIPERLVRDLSKLEPISNRSWMKAKEKGDFSIFEKDLGRMISLKKEVAEHVGYEETPYDALLDDYEPRMRTREAGELLQRVRERLVPLAKKISESGTVIDETVVKRGYPVAAQTDLSMKVLSLMGYDLDRGRLDVSAHPFTNGSCYDVRITTRFAENDLRPALYATIHEGGHALYEQGFLEEHYDTPLAEAVSMGIHESQSRLWENIVGRGLPFCRHLVPLVQKELPGMSDVTVEQFYRAINPVRPSFIRIEADEVTYNLHILVRFEMEKAIFEGKIDLKDVPEEWNSRYEKYLGIRPENDSKGCLQDIHWAIGYFGYFPTYTLGNLYASQFYNAARKALPDMENRAESGDLRPLLAWLRENIHRHGRLYSAADLVRRVTGGPLSEEPFIAHLRKKFSPIYDVQL